MDGQDGRDKEKSVREMFARIAHRYDLVNRLMSWGQDVRWRQQAVRLAYPSQGRVLDVATGTGDLALELARYSDSVGCFISKAELQRIMEGVGFSQVRYKSLNFGTVAIHVGVK